MNFTVKSTYSYFVTPITNLIYISVHTGYKQFQCCTANVAQPLIIHPIKPYKLPF